MPATTRQDNGAEVGEDVDEGSVGPDGAPPGVTDYLDMALTAASDQGMSASELMGVFFYYAHSIADSYRQDVLGEIDKRTD